MSIDAIQTSGAPAQAGVPGASAVTIDSVTRMWDADPAFTFTGLWRSVTRRGARRWYIGSLVSLSWLVNAGFELFANYPSAADRVGIVVMLAVFAIAFAIVPPLNWMLPARLRLLPPTALLALSFALLPWLDWGVYSLWTYVGVAAAMSGNF